ncbi:hypothetical protein [Streptomyces sp. NPDC006879]|uniref:hypothetical protein n=1 Tax=Streptomyces sp. NPDC006879 TaxID=3364767 RepID=UPI003693A5A2
MTRLRPAGTGEPVAEGAGAAEVEGRGDGSCGAAVEPSPEHPAVITASTRIPAPRLLLTTPHPRRRRAEQRVWSHRPARVTTPEAVIRGIPSAPLRLLPAALALALGLWGIDRDHSLWRDESVTYQVAHRPLGAILELLGNVDAVHGLYYLLMHAVFAFADGPADSTGGLLLLRLPSVLAVALAATGVSEIGRLLAGPATGGWAGGLFAALPPVQMYAQDGRSYALVAAAVVWATYLMLRQAWAGYTLVLGLACWLHEFAALVLLAHAVTLRRPPPGWWRAAAGVMALILPLAYVSARQAGQQLGWLGRPSWTDWLTYLVVAALGLVLTHLVEAPQLVRLALPLLLVPAGLLLPLSLLHPWYVDRYVLYSLSGIALLGGAAAARLRHRRVSASLAACLAFAALPWSLWLRTPDSRKDDVAAVAAAVRAQARPGDAVLYLPARRREWLLSFPDVRQGLVDPVLDRSPAGSNSLQGAELDAEAISERLRSVPRVLALTDPPDQPLDPFPFEAAKRQVLAADFRVCSSTEVRGAQVVLYARPGRCAG